MKKLLAIVLALGLALTGCSAASSQKPAEESAGIYTPGTYTASASGMGKITVEMTFDANTITAVNATGADETAGIGTLALEQLPGAILEKQSAEVDAVASATITSNAIITAAKSCIDQAMGIETDTTAENVLEQTADVVVVGAGGAGLAAAASAGQNGASVIILEANGIVGGSTIRSGGHMLVFDEAINASMDRNDDAVKVYLDYDPADFGEWGDTLVRLQEQVKEYLSSNTEGRFDSVEMALIDHFIKGQGEDLEGNAVTNDFQMVKTAFENATALNEWLVSGGMGIQDKLFTTHSGTPVNGASGMVGALQSMAEEAGAQIVLNMRATELLMENGKAVGVKAIDADGTEHIYHANKGVILATGSFSSNGEMCAEYQTIGKGLGADNGSTNPATNTGDGIVMAQSAGAQLRDMGFMCTTLTGYHNSCSSAEFNKINGKQQLVVNAEGKRFMDGTKASGMSMVINVINDQTDGLVYYIGDSAMLNALNAVSETFVDDMTSRGDWFVVADTLEEALSKARLDVATTMETIETFNSYVDAENDPDFGRTKFNGKVENGPYVVVKMESHYHLTFGGLVIDTNAQVLDQNDQPIAHLYAAGDITSGFEGDVHQSGDCLTNVLYYGKVAGEQAAAN